MPSAKAAIRPSRWHCRFPPHSGEHDVPGGKLRPVGDTLFMPDVGTARADFPDCNTHALYRSIRKLLALTQKTKIFVRHNYSPACRSGRPPWVSSARTTFMCMMTKPKKAFIAIRTAKGTPLGIPMLILPAI